MKDSLSVRFAHLSDFHLRRVLPGTSKLGKRRSRELLLERVLADIVKEQVDLIVITGDLLDVPEFLLEGGLPRGFEMTEGHGPWLPMVEEDYRYVRKRLEETGIPWIVLPGNHDFRPIYEKVFGDRPDDQKLCGFRWVTFADEEQDHHQPRRLNPQRLLFEKVLGDDDPTPQIHLQHYLLQDFRGIWQYRYLEYEFLTSQIARSEKVVLSLSGHAHAGMCPEKIAGTWFSVAPGICEAPHSWRIFEISGQEVRWEERSLAQESPSPVVFLDRDGVINDLACYFYGPEEMRLIPGAGAAIARLNANGVKVVVVTSQSAIGMGYVSEPVVKMVMERMHQLLAREGAFVDAVYYTKGAGPDSVVPELRDAPTAKSSIILQALEELPLRPDGWIVGDRLTDMEAGKEAGLPGRILVRTGLGNEEETKIQSGDSLTVVDHLGEAVELILRSV